MKTMRHFFDYTKFHKNLDWNKRINISVYRCYPDTIITVIGLLNIRERIIIGLPLEN
jgi:hypothetical protein